MPKPLFEVFVAGKLRRQENGPQGGWQKKAGYRKAWRTRVQVQVLRATYNLVIDPTTPKTVRLRCRVFNLFDDGGLWSALKPCIDALVPCVIHSDAPFSKSGHLILPGQQIDRKAEGVWIIVDEGVDLR